MVDATSALIPALVEIWSSALNTLYISMHSVSMWGVPLDAIVGAIIFMQCVIGLYLWRLR